MKNKYLIYGGGAAAVIAVTLLALYGGNSTLFKGSLGDIIPDASTTNSAGATNAVTDLANTANENNAEDIENAPIEDGATPIENAPIEDGATPIENAPIENNEDLTIIESKTLSKVKR